MTAPVIDLQQLYPNLLKLERMTDPFSEKEILNALKDILMDKSPRPDGFGSGFYQDFST